MVTEPHGQIDRTTARRRFGMAAAGVLAAAALMTGCAAGQQSQTTAEVPVVDGVAANSGQIAIRAAAVAAPPTTSGYAAGSDAPLKLVIVNSGTSSVALRSVTSPAAPQVTLGLKGPADTSGTASQNTTIAIPSGGSVQIGYATLGPTITLAHLAQALYPAQPISVTFTFTDGSTITTTLAVQITSGANDAPTLDITPPGEG